VQFSIAQIISDIRTSPGTACITPSDLETLGGSGVLFGMVVDGCDAAGINGWRSRSSSGIRKFITAGAENKITMGLFQNSYENIPLLAALLLPCVMVLKLPSPSIN